MADIPRRHSALHTIVDGWYKGRRRQVVLPGCACNATAVQAHLVDDPRIGQWYLDHIETALNHYVEKQRAWMLTAEEYEAGQDT